MAGFALTGGSVGLEAQGLLRIRLGLAKLRAVALPTLHGEQVTLRQVADADIDALVAFIDEPGVNEWWGPDRTPEYRRWEVGGESFAIETRDGELCGWLGFEEETDPGYRSVALDVFIADAHQSRGLGPDALRAAMRWFVAERGHHRFSIDPAVTNERAIRAYASVGFEPVGVTRKSELGRDGEWRDNLLMDLLVEERPELAP
jgi:aminoglycoside 6'-N-acetyltransferase